MEGSESEAIFDSFNLNPQLFINEVLNHVDDVVDDAFDFLHREASTKLNSEDNAQRSQDLRKGVDSIRRRIQSDLDKKLAVWEKYCLRHCFSVPQGFVMPKSDESSQKGLHQDVPVDPETDAQLDSLRKKLIEVGKESEMLNEEIQALERQSTVNARYINEAVQIYEQNSLHDLFQELVTTASELGMKMGKLNNGMIEETEQRKAKRVYNAKKYLSDIDHAKGLSNVKLEDLQQFLTMMKSM